MRGKLAVQHYTGSMINVLLGSVSNSKPTPETFINLNPFKRSYSDVLRNGSSPSTELSTAQPQLVKSSTKQSRSVKPSPVFNTQNSDFLASPTRNFRRF